MEIKEIDDKISWEEFLAVKEEKTFLQSWNWGEFNLAMQNKIWRLAAYSNERLEAVALVINISAKRANFFLIPHGPVFRDDITSADKKLILELLLAELKKISLDQKADFIRIAPLLHDVDENKDIFLDLGFIRSPMHASAYDATWKLDVSRSEQDMLRDMRKTTRYLIKKTSTDPLISIEKSSDPADISKYQQLNAEVAKRQNFIPFPNEFIKNEFESFIDDNEAVFFFGKYDNQIVCGALVIFWSGIAFYHQAASLGEFAKFSVPYLLQWEAIKEAKKRGCLIYDFWGFTDPNKHPKHPWAGPTLFKMGFGGYKAEYIKPHDFPLTHRYWLNYIFETVRKFKRGLN